MPVRRQRARRRAGCIIGCRAGFRISENSEKIGPALKGGAELFRRNYSRCDEPERFVGHSPTLVSQVGTQWRVDVDQPSTDLFLPNELTVQAEKGWLAGSTGDFNATC